MAACRDGLSLGPFGALLYPSGGAAVLSTLVQFVHARRRGGWERSAVSVAVYSSASCLDFFCKVVRVLHPQRPCTFQIPATRGEQRDRGVQAEGTGSSAYLAMADESSSEDAPKVPFTLALIAGGCAGTAVDVALYPLDTLRTRMQVRPHAHMVSCLVTHGQLDVTQVAGSLSLIVLLIMLSVLCSLTFLVVVLSAALCSPYHYCALHTTVVLSYCPSHCACSPPHCAVLLTTVLSPPR